MTIEDAKDARIQELEELLQLDHEHYVRPFNLTQQQAKLMALLMDAPVATAETIHKRVGMDTEAKVVAHRLRQRLKPFGIKISAKRFVGFWLSDEDKAKVKEIIDG